MRPTISIVVLNWNTLDLVQRCVHSLRRWTPDTCELLLVDNGSSDGSAAWLAELDDARTRVVLLPQNRGYAAGNNEGLRLAQGEAVVLVNSDVAVTRGWLEPLWRMSCDGAGLVGPTTNQCGGPQRRRLWLGRFPPPAWFRFDRDVDALSFFCVLIHRRVIDAIGLLDERFGTGYYEDDDYCRRAREMGFRLRISGKSWVWHEGNATFRANAIDVKQALQRNRELFDQKWRRRDDAA